MSDKEKTEYEKLKEVRFEPIESIVFYGNRQDLKKIARDIIDKCERFLNEKEEMKTIDNRPDISTYTNRHKVLLPYFNIFNELTNNKYNLGIWNIQNRRDVTVVFKAWVAYIFYYDKGWTTKDVAKLLGLKSHASVLNLIKVYWDNKPTWKYQQLLNKLKNQR